MSVQDAAKTRRLEWACEQLAIDPALEWPEQRGALFNRIVARDGLRTNELDAICSLLTLREVRSSDTSQGEKTFHFEQNVLRREVSQFSETFFELPPDERRNQWQLLTSLCHALLPGSLEGRTLENMKIGLALTKPEMETTDPELRAIGEWVTYYFCSPPNCRVRRWRSILAEESLKRYRAAAFRFEQSLPRWAALAPELLSAIKSARSAEEFESQRRRRQAVYSAWQREAEQEHTEDAELSTEWVAYCVIVGVLVAISLICLVANEPPRSNQPTGRRSYLAEPMPGTTAESLFLGMTLPPDTMGRIRRLEEMVEESPASPDSHRLLALEHAQAIMAHVSLRNGVLAISKPGLETQQGHLARSVALYIKLEELVSERMPKKTLMDSARRMIKTCVAEGQYPEAVEICTRLTQLESWPALELSELATEMLAVRRVVGQEAPMRNSNAPLPDRLRQTQTDTASARLDASMEDHQNPRPSGRAHIDALIHDINAAVARVLVMLRDKSPGAYENCISSLDMSGVAEFIEAHDTESHVE